MKLDQQYKKMWKQRGASYKPRTRHTNPDGSPKYTNRLFLESSPYLLQHAHNPVDWFPWGDEAFETAKRLKRPVLLSVGYSTCHWCHVMEEESFEDEDIAAYLNNNYIAVKVDREERPDIDAIYMKAVQTLTGGGGWPMTVWLTPERKPFYAGTYFPARDGERGANMGFLTLIGKLKAIFDDDPDRVLKGSQQITNLIRKQMTPQGGDDQLPDDSVIQEALHFYTPRYDHKNGGLQGAPKFPSSLPLRLLLRRHLRTGEVRPLEMVNLTLLKMAYGGLYDQVGGGFHRYSTDERWRIPHFEKMLYDNALLIMAYLEGLQATGEPEFRRVIIDTLDYVKMEMTSPEGAFYSATDADSLTPEGVREEGYFFTWTPRELENVLGSEDAQVAAQYYAVESSGNFMGRNILHVPHTHDAAARRLGLSSKDLRRKIETINRRLRSAREQRPRPLRDEKILCSWNGLMISAHAQAGFILRDPHYTDRAARAAEFIMAHLFVDGRLRRSYKDGQARHDGYLQDYAFLTAALLDLFEATHDLSWLKQAIQLDAILEAHYEDKQKSAFFMTADDHEDLIAREKPAHDGATPSGNSVAIMNLLRLHAFTTQDRYRERAVKGLKAFSHTLRFAPQALSEMLLAVDFFLNPPKEIIIVAAPEPSDTAQSFLTVLGRYFVPNRIVVAAFEGENLEARAEIIPLVKGKTTINGQTAAYVCQNGVCQLPFTDPLVFEEMLKKESIKKKPITEV